MNSSHRYLRYLVYTVAGVMACAIAFMAYAQQSDLPAGWEEPSAPLPPGSVRLEDVGKPTPSTAPPAEPAPAEQTPAEAASTEAAPAEPSSLEKGVYDSTQRYPGAQISTIPPVTGPHAGTPPAATPSSAPVGAPAAAPTAAPSGGMSDLPAGWEEPAAPLPPGSVRIEDMGTKPAAPAAAPAAETKAKKVDETEEVRGDVMGEEEEESFQKPSRWDNY